ncbi:MAG TPA: hypothetical protein VFA58_00840, partial [Chthoniobacterales bacterium]|nr:hypothetical protein [Chthoniobacterales bacterium]
PPTDSLKHPIGLLLFLLLYQGNSITFSPSSLDYFLAARWVGAALIALFLFASVYVVIRWKDRGVRDPMLVWLMLGAYSILNGLLIALSRMEITPMAATWTRYISYSIFLPVSLIFVIPIVVRDTCRYIRPGTGRILMRVACAFLAATLVLQIFKFREAVASFEEIRAARAQRKAQLLFIDLVRFDSTTGKSWREQTLDDIRPVADALNAPGWINPPLIQRPRMQDLQDSTVTNSQSYGRMEKAGSAGDGEIAVMGWAYEPRERRLADSVVVSWEKPGGDAVPFAIAESGVVRPGEATNSRLRYAGWQVAFPGEVLPAETLDLRAWSFDIHSGKAVLLPGVFRLTPRTE